jgi:hypothetical protein
MQKIYICYMALFSLAIVKLTISAVVINTPTHSWDSFLLYYPTFLKSKGILDICMKTIIELSTRERGMCNLVYSCWS